MVTLARIERYDIEPSAHGTVLRMRQGLRALGVALLALGVLLLSWWSGPYGPRPASAWGQSDVFYWLWSGFFGLLFVLGLLGAVYREDWSITDHEILVTKSLGPWRTVRRVPTARPLAIRVEMIAARDDGPVFPFRLRFLDAEGNSPGLRIDLQLARSVDQFLNTLRGAVPLEVDDLREIHEEDDGR